MASIKVEVILRNHYSDGSEQDFVLTEVTMLSTETDEFMKVSNALLHAAGAVARVGVEGIDDGE